MLTEGFRARLVRRAELVLRSAGVGVAATALDLLLLSLMVSGFGMHPRLASPPALLAGILVQFFGNKLFAFRDRSRQWGRQVGLFLAVECIGYFANVILYDVAVSLAGTNASLPQYFLPVRMLTQSLVYFGICLPLWSQIFRSRVRDPAYPVREES